MKIGQVDSLSLDLNDDTDLIKFARVGINGPGYEK